MTGQAECLYPVGHDGGETMNSDQILSEYLNGDEDRRMSLFLYYRELRDDFTAIDGQEQGFADERNRIRSKPGDYTSRDPKDKHERKKLSGDH
jgi:hypothetical protein